MIAEIEPVTLDHSTEPDPEAQGHHVQRSMYIACR